MSLLFTICALHFVAQLSPGPDVLLIAKSSASTTRKKYFKNDLRYFCWNRSFRVVLTLVTFDRTHCQNAVDSTSIDGGWWGVPCTYGLADVESRPQRNAARSLAR